MGAESREVAVCDGNDKLRPIRLSRMCPNSHNGGESLPAACQTPAWQS
jgi:hypothetical protein